MKPNKTRELDPASKTTKNSSSSIPKEIKSAPDAASISSYVEICDYDLTMNTNDKASGSANNDCIQRVQMLPESHYLKLQPHSTTSEMYTNLNQPTPSEDVVIASPQSVYYNSNDSEIWIVRVVTSWIN